MKDVGLLQSLTVEGSVLVWDPPPSPPPVSARYPLYLTDSAEFPLVYLKITQLESSPFCFQCLDLR